MIELGLNIGRMINRVLVHDKLHELSKQYLTEIDEANITLFANKAKQLVDNTFDEFIISQEQMYLEDSFHAIKDKTILLAFTDVQTGYRRQMQNWIESHPVEVKKQTISIDNLPTSLPLKDRESLKRSMSTLGVGTIGVVCLKFLTGISWSWIGLVELAVMALSVQQYRVGKRMDDRRYEQFQKDWIESEKINIVNRIDMELGKWLDAAEHENTRILKTFGL